jgi:hypothetical protein
MLTAEDFDPGFDYSYKVSKKKNVTSKKNTFKKKMLTKNATI